MSLEDDSGSGVAEGDQYAGFERVLGSRGGADVLGGDGLADTLSGMGGADAMLAGPDVVEGGTGADRLRGGAGNDAFVFLRPDQGGDRVLDWGQTGNNDDRFEVSAHQFGSGLVARALPSGRFVARADNHAQDGGDRFMFRTTDATLWWDEDGSGSAATVLLADLGAGASVTVGDILVV